MARWQWGSTPERLRAAVDAAEHLFLHHGYSKVTLEDISSASGLSTGSLYHHFDSPKEDLFQVVMDRVWDRFYAEVDRTDLPGSYLRACWRYRDYTLAFNFGDCPPGWSTRRFAHAELNKIFPGDESVMHHLVRAIALEAGYLVSGCSTEAEVEEMIPTVATAMRLIDALGPGSTFASPT